MYATTFYSDPPSALVYRRLSARQAAVGIVLTLLAFAGGMLLIDLRYELPGNDGERLEALWAPGTLTMPDSYELWGSDGSYLAAASLDRWRYDRGGQTIRIGDGSYVWDTRGPGVYNAFPYASKVASGEITDVPRLQDGRPITADTSPRSTWRTEHTLGPARPERLMVEVEMARRYGGTWTLSKDLFLGIEVQVLRVEIPDLPGGQISPGGRYTRTIKFDPRYLLVLSDEMTSTFSSYRIEAIELRLNQSIDDSVFQFVPPAGTKQCLPPQFANRGPGC
jgi:hypothetical protein